MIRLFMRTRQEYIEILRNHADELRTNYGISYMRLFGSVAKDEHHSDSDVDLFVVMPAKAYTLCAAADYLESILGTSVDLIRKHNNMRPFFLNQINKYGIDIFGQA
ncbi:MAG: nucleotidyltransferase family protein [Bacteroidaceae bacterium]|nr:nucleotidyltransferase family protein [Bacteroidaceae bacterium]